MYKASLPNTNIFHAHLNQLDFMLFQFSWLLPVPTYEQREKEIHPKNNHNCGEIITSQRRKINGFILLSNYKLTTKSNCPINFKQKQYLSVGENDFIFTTYTLTHSVLL